MPDFDLGGRNFAYRYDLDDEYRTFGGTPAVCVFVGAYSDDEDASPFDEPETIDSCGAVEVPSLWVSDHGNIHLSDKDEAYCKGIAIDIAADFLGEDQELLTSTEG